MLLSKMVELPTRSQIKSVELENPSQCTFPYSFKQHLQCLIWTIRSFSPHKRRDFLNCSSWGCGTRLHTKGNKREREREKENNIWISFTVSEFPSLLYEAPKSRSVGPAPIWNSHLCCSQGTHLVSILSLAWVQEEDQGTSRLGCTNATDYVVKLCCL